MRGAPRRGEARPSGSLFILRGVLYQLVFQHFAARIHRRGIEEEDTARPLEACRFPFVRQKSSTVSAVRSGEPLTMKAETTLPHCASGRPTTAASWTPGQR